MVNTTNTSHTFTGLNPSTKYKITVKARDGAGNVSSGVSLDVVTVEYIDSVEPILTITEAQTFTDSMTVNMSTNETATIWYTLDDSDPTTSGTRLQYTSPLTLTETDTIKAYAVDSANNVSAVQTVVFTKKEVPSNKIFADAEGYLSMPINYYSWAFLTGHETATHLGLAGPSLNSLALYEDGTDSTKFTVEGMTWLTYVSNMASVTEEGYTISDYGSSIGKTLLWLEKATKGSTVTEMQNWIIASGLTMKLKLASTYKTWDVPSNVSNFSTRAASAGKEYFKVTLLDGLGVFTGTTTTMVNSLGFVTHPSYSWTNANDNIKVNPDGTLEMQLPSGTLTSMDATGVSNFLASTGIKIYYV